MGLFVLEDVLPNFAELVAGLSGGGHICSRELYLGVDGLIATWYWRFGDLEVWNLVLCIIEIEEILKRKLDF